MTRALQNDGLGGRSSRYKPVTGGARAAAESASRTIGDGHAGEAEDDDNDDCGDGDSAL